MASIIEGTTPTIIYKFKHIEVSDLVVAILTIKKGDSVILMKELPDATVDTEKNRIGWKLTQQESLSIGEGSRKLMLNWKLDDLRTRGGSRETEVVFTGNHIKEVI